MIRALEGGDTITFYPATGNPVSQNITGFSSGETSMMNAGASIFTLPVVSIFSKA